MTSSPVAIGLVRHSMTVWNEQKRIQGHRNSPLSARGREMAAAWGAALRPFQWDRIISSDLDRARETAAIINQHLQLPCLEDARLREQNWGDWTGLTLNEVKLRHKNRLKAEQKKGWGFQPPGGESRMQVLERAHACQVEAGMAWPGQNLLIVCHEGVIKCLLYHLSRRAFLPEEPPLLKRYHLHLLTATNAELAIVSLNHLSLGVR